MVVRPTLPTTAPDVNPTPFTTAHGFSLRWQMLVFLLSCVIIISRRPDAFFHAHFYAEDGAIWFGDAYNWGWWKALFWPNSGYIQLLPRLAASFALLAPVVYGPLVENLIAIAVQALPVNVLLYSGSRTWGSLRFRAMLALLYLALPNTQEMFGSVTQSQWFLALCAFLLIIGEPPRSQSARIFFLASLILCCLTGPFCIFLLPIGVLMCLRSQRKERWAWVGIAVLFLGSVIQGLSLFKHLSGRPNPKLGISFESVMRILGGKVYFGALIGSHRRSMHLPTVELACIVAVGSAFLFLFVYTAGIEIRTLAFFSWLLFIPSLARPSVYPPHGQTAWDILANTPGHHYWFFPSLTIAWSLAWCARKGTGAQEHFESYHPPC